MTSAPSDQLPLPGIQPSAPAASPLGPASGSFLAHMSHELRTPLNAIIGYAELIREELEEIGRYGIARDVDRVLRAAGSMTSLIDDFMDLAHLESGAATLAAEDLDLSELIHELAVQHHALAVRHGDTLQIHGAASVEPMVGDPVRVRQAISEVIENACRYTRDGQIDIHILRLPSDQGDRLLVQVSDTGPGVPAPEQLRLFEPFYTLSPRKAQTGAGIGLTISRHLCRMMGGDLTLQSVYGEGATFTVELPARPTTSR